MYRKVSPILRDANRLLLEMEQSVRHFKEAGYLKGGLKRRLITRIHVNPGVPLCYTA